MTAPTDLIERLRASDTLSRGENYEPWVIPPSELRLEAADEIASLRELWEIQADKATTAEAERDALRAALQTSLVAMKLAAALPGVSDEYDFAPATKDAARALSGKGDGE